ncbi:MAG: tRNA 2-thiouridine(34) synthase MnmA [bacterium]
MDALNGKTVFVGLSGGVDSSVTAALLKKTGATVVGVFIRTWQPDFIECSFREDRLDAMRVATHLDIPFLECDAEDAYKRAVADYMIDEYKAGRTPNPDVMCNREIKFGVFWEFAKKHGAEYIATGHYAENEHGLLKIAADASKDQAYFLYRLTSADLAHVLFPLGKLEKTEVRTLAQKFGLPTQAKKDSQGICMLGDLDLKKFLEHYIPTETGNVLSEAGDVIGHHSGAIFLTLGERHGFTITKKTPQDDRYYIIAKDIEHNTITVSMDRSTVSPHSEAKTEMEIAKCSWVNGFPEKNKKYVAQVRYHGEYLACEVSAKSDMTARVTFLEPTLVARGQSIVIFDGDVCLGGGIIHA